jgi:hypothetical protein
MENSMNMLTANGKRVEPVHTTGGGYSYGGGW